MTLAFDSAAFGPLVHAHASFAAGVTTVLGSDAGALDALVALASGEHASQRGSVLVDGAPPVTVPAARRKVASLRAVELLPPARNVAASLSLALAARGLPSDVQALLTTFQLGAYASHPLASLSPSDLRLLALALALHDERATVLALFEPLATALPRDQVLELLALRARSATVLALTSSLEDARSLGGTWFVLERGVLAAPGHDAFALGSGTEKAFVVRSPQARQLAGYLAASQAVAAVEWDERRAEHELRVHGANAAELCLTVARASAEHGLRVELVTPVVPSLEAILAARTGLVQGAYETAYRAAQAGAQASAQGRAVFAAPYAAPVEYRSAGAKAPENQSVSLEAPRSEEEPKP